MRERRARRSRRDRAGDGQDHADRLLDEEEHDVRLDFVEEEEELHSPWSHGASPKRRSGSVVSLFGPGSGSVSSSASVGSRSRQRSRSSSVLRNQTAAAAATQATSSQRRGALEGNNDPSSWRSRWRARTERWGFNSVKLRSWRGEKRRQDSGSQQHRRNRDLSVGTAASSASWGSILSANLKRVRSISHLMATQSRYNSQHYDDSDFYDSSDVSTATEVEYSSRMLKRDTWYHQSTGDLVVDQVGTANTLRDIFSLYRDDWFHVALTQSTFTLFFALLTLYTTYLLFFAGVYFAVRGSYDPVCALDPTDPADEERAGFLMAFAFALETAATSGYGLPNDNTTSFWQDCFRVPAIVWFQTFVGILLNALVISLVVTRVGRADTRSHQVVFSDKATIINRNGKFFFSFQCYDLDQRSPIVEGHVRCYAVLNESDGQTTANFQTRHMRVIQPDDMRNASLFLSVPCTVVHEIDQWSPLLPPTMRREHWHTHNDKFVHNDSNRYQFPNLILREADSAIGMRHSANCPVCGETFPTDEHLLRHVRYLQYIESQEEEENPRPEGDQIDANDDDVDDENPSHRRQVHRTGTATRAELSMAQLIQSNEDCGELPPTLGAVLLRGPGFNGRVRAESERSGVSGRSDPFTSGSGAVSRTKSEAGALKLERSASAHESRHHNEHDDEHDDDDYGRNHHTEHHHHHHHHQHHHHHNHHHHQHHHHQQQTSSVQKRLEKTFKEEIRKGVSKSIRQHKTVKLNRLPATIDDKLKQLADLNCPVGHKGLSVEALISHDRVVTEAEQREKEMDERRRKLRESTGSASRQRTCSLKRENKFVKDIKESLHHFIESSNLEVVVLLEGIEPQGSATFQARHSYTIDDIVFDHWFVKCIGRDPKDSSGVSLDLNNFHETVPVGPKDPIPVQAIL